MAEIINHCNCDLFLKHILLLTILCCLNIIEQHMCRVKVMQYSLASNILKGYAKCTLLHSKHQILFLVSCRKKVCSDTVNLFYQPQSTVYRYAFFSTEQERGGNESALLGFACSGLN